MFLISDDYRRLSSELHNREEEYGVTFPWFVDKVRRIIEEWKPRTILDYGCGKGELEKVLGGLVRSYDPCIAQFSHEPKPADCLVSIAVLEHVEPECVVAVLDHMAALTERFCYLMIACVPSMHNLPDGRNSHLTIMPPEWWLPQLMERWNFHVIRRERRGLEFTGLAK